MEQASKKPMKNFVVDHTLNETILNEIEGLKGVPSLQITQRLMPEIKRTNLFQQIKQFNTDVFCNRFCSLILPRIHILRLNPGDQLKIGRKVLSSDNDLVYYFVKGKLEVGSYSKNVDLEDKIKKFTNFIGDDQSHFLRMRTDGQ